LRQPCFARASLSLRHLTYQGNQPRDFGVCSRRFEVVIFSEASRLGSPEGLPCLTDTKFQFIVYEVDQFVFRLDT
jgi:hypothetical protein